MTVLNAYPQLSALLHALDDICGMRGMRRSDILDAYIDFDEDLLTFYMQYSPNQNIGFSFPVFFDFHLLIEEGLKYIHERVEQERKIISNDNQR